MYHEMVCRDVVSQLTHSLLKPTTCPIEAFRYDVARKSLTKKATPELARQLGIPTLTPDELALTSVNSFREQEGINRTTNDRILNATSGYMAAISHRASRIAFSILGELEFSDVINNSGFGPGTMVGCTGVKLDLPKKFGVDITYTPECSDFVPVIQAEIPCWQAETKLVMGGEYFTVPKDAKTDRGCEKQPILNLYLQKGIGAMMRRKLLKHGINLNDQSINQRRAREGSITDSLVTWDGRNASNSLTRELVRSVLFHCPDWFWFMDKIRTHRVLLPDGSWHELEMFSAMGNGFTFELESLLFYCLAKAAADHNNLNGLVTVYGDDMIFPTAWLSPVIEVFDHFGIATNKEKSFSSGPFRESCGGDYYLGNCVTPLYLKKPIKGLSDLIRLANRIRDVSAKWHDYLYADNTWKSAWESLCCYILAQGGQYGPSNVDGVLHTDSLRDLSYNDLGHLRLNRVLTSTGRRYETGNTGRMPASLYSLGHFGTISSSRSSFHRSSLAAIARDFALRDAPHSTVERHVVKGSSVHKWKRMYVSHPVWAPSFNE